MNGSLTPETPYQISEIAKKAGVSLRTARFYQQEGLIVPHLRTTSGMRLYCEQDINRIKLIRRLKNTGMSLDDIKALIGKTGNCDRLEMIENTLKILQVEAANSRKRIAELKRQDEEREEIVKLVKECLSCDLESCPTECAPRTHIIR